MRKCHHCQKETEDLIMTDQFGQTALCLLCPDCFYELAQTAFHYPDLICTCGERLVLTDDKEIVIDLARENDEITYRCQYVEDARILSRQECVIELDRLHDKKRFRSVEGER